jgi:hypothetical protein
LNGPPKLNGITAGAFGFLNLLFRCAPLSPPRDPERAEAPVSTVRTMPPGRMLIAFVAPVDLSFYSATIRLAKCSECPGGRGGDEKES